MLISRAVVRPRGNLTQDKIFACSWLWGHLSSPPTTIPGCEVDTGWTLRWTLTAHCWYAQYSPACSSTAALAEDLLFDSALTSAKCPPPISVQQLLPGTQAHYSDTAAASVAPGSVRAMHVPCQTRHLRPLERVSQSRLVESPRYCSSVAVLG